MLRFVKRWPFLTLGLVTFALFMAVELLTSSSAGCYSSVSVAVSGDGKVISHQESSGCQASRLTQLTSVLGPLIAPLWLMRYLEMFIGIGFLPWPWQLIVALPLLFLPYIAADLILRAIIRFLPPKHSFGVNS